MHPYFRWLGILCMCLTLGNTFGLCRTIFFCLVCGPLEKSKFIINLIRGAFGRTSGHNFFMSTQNGSKVELDLRLDMSVPHMETPHKNFSGTRNVDDPLPNIVNTASFCGHSMHCTTLSNTFGLLFFLLSVVPSQKKITH